MNDAPAAVRTPPGAPAAVPRPVLRVRDTVAMVIGLVIGVGIFTMPPLVAANVDGPLSLLGLWLAGGLVSLLGALCYAELACAYPHAGGEYHFLSRAFGPTVAFLFGWSRALVIGAGSIALLAFAIGDYAGDLLRLDATASAVAGVIAVGAFTLLNARGIEPGKTAQNLLTTLEVLGLLLICVAGLGVVAPDVSADPAGGTPSAAQPGLALVFVLLAYGGWTDAACLSAEVAPAARGFLRALVLALVALTALYLAVNLALLHGLGFAALARSEAVASQVLQAAWGAPGQAAVGVIVLLSLLTSLNAAIIVGGRFVYALGRDWRALAPLGDWQAARGTPRNALLAQGALVFMLLAIGSLAPDGLTAMVEYTAPVYWLFVLLVGVALFVLRRQDPTRARPFLVPLYPLTPLAFCLLSAYLCYASLAYSGRGALIGMAVLASGALALAMARARHAVRRG